MSQLRCTWCCKDVESGPPCPQCGNFSVVDRTKPHQAEWSRKTMRSMECKVCDRTISNEDYFKGNFDPQCKPKPDLVGEFSRALSKAGYITNEGEKQ